MHMRRVRRGVKGKRYWDGKTDGHTPTHTTNTQVLHNLCQERE